MSQSDTKQKLINSAVKVFSEKGYFNTKVSDIVKDAGVAQGTFYLYFKSKEEIFLSVVESIVKQIENITEKFRKIDLETEEKIIRFGNEIFRVLYSYREIAYIYFFQLLCMDDKFKQIYVSTNEKIKSFYIDILKDFGNRELLTDLFMGFGKRLFEFNILIENQPLDKIIREFEEGVNIIFRGIK
ncbi:TetR/AcrR family transcriptional regulator [Persephonella sp.]